MALRDSESAMASYRFTIHPGLETIIDVKSVASPRVDLPHIGSAATTSISHFDASGGAGIDELRSAVHVSDGLQLVTGRGDQLRRRRANSCNRQIMVLADRHPRRFSVMPRERFAAGCQEFEANGQKRLALWVEPIGEGGGVQIVEIPGRNGIHSRAVTFWRPSHKLTTKSEYSYPNLFHYCNEATLPPDLARIERTSVGAHAGNTRLLVLEIGGGKLQNLPIDCAPTLDVTGHHGKILHVNVQPNPLTGGWRASFEVQPDNAKVVEIRAQLVHAATPISGIGSIDGRPRRYSLGLHPADAATATSSQKVAALQPSQTKWHATAFRDRLGARENRGSDAQDDAGAE